MTKENRAFDKILIEALDEALTSLGESAKQSIYFHLEDKFKITKDDIPDRIDELSEGLEKIFGLGAHFIEILIMRSLFKKTEQPIKMSQSEKLEFAAYVNAVRQSYLKKRKTTKA